VRGAEEAVDMVDKPKTASANWGRNKLSVAIKNHGSGGNWAPRSAFAELERGGQVRGKWQRTIKKKKREAFTSSHDSRGKLVKEG